MKPNRQPTIYDQRYKKAIKILILARKNAGLSQAELAYKTNFTQPDISKIEQLDRRLDVTELFDIVRAISNSDDSMIKQILEKIYECHDRSQ